MTCPDDNELTEFVAGVLSGEAVQSIESHIDACARCRETLVELAHCARPSEPAPDAPWIREGLADGRYVPMHVLGAGGMSMVYEGFDQDLRRPVAIKVMLDAHAAAGDRLAREARALARLSHANVVDVFDVALSHGNAFLITELVEGGSLRAWLREKPRSAKEVVAVLVDVARGLQAAHAQGIVHRDVTPNNILVGHDGRARIADFGLTHLLSDPAEEGSQPTGQAGDRTTAAGGTPGYIAPEVLAGDSAGPAADQYGLSATGVEVLEGVDGVPKAVLRVLARGRSHAAGDRFPSMTEFASALSNARRAGVRRPTVAVFAVALAVAGFVGWTHAGEPEACGRFRIPQVQTGVLGFDRVAARTVQRWADTRQRLCASEDLDPTIFDRRWECLRRHRQQLEAHADRVPPASVAGELEPHLRALEQLADPTDCEDDDRLASAVSIPPRAQRPAVDAARAVLTEVSADLQIEHTKAARERLEPLVAQAEAIGHAPLVADVLVVLGRLQRESGQTADAIETLTDAAHVAAAAGLDLPAARAWLFVVFTVGHDAMDLDAALASLRFADTYLTRLGNPPQLMAQRAQTLGVLYSRRGDHERAGSFLRDAVVQFRRARGPSSLALAQAHSDLGVNQARSGEFDAAWASFTEARRIVVAQLGAGTAKEGESLANLAALELSRNDMAAATTLAGQALQLLEPALDDDDERLATLRGTLGQGLLFQDQPQEALPYLRGAHRSLAAKAPPNHPAVLQAKYQLSMALRRVGAGAEAQTLMADVPEHTDNPAIPDHLRGLLLFEVGRLALERGEPSEAARVCATAVELLTRVGVQQAQESAQACLDDAQREQRAKAGAGPERGETLDGPGRP